MPPVRRPRPFRLLPILAFLLARAASGQSAPAPDSLRDTTDRRAGPTPPGGVRIDGLLQVWYLSGRSVIYNHDTFRIRRADLKISGEISPRVHWRISLDGAKALAVTKAASTALDSAALRDVSIDQRSRILQEASINVLAGGVRFDVGQQIIPLGFEGSVSSGQIETIERTMFIAERTRGGGLGDIRDIGASVRGGLARTVDYQVGVFNEAGESQNQTDQNDQKTIIGRLVARAPFWPALQVGGSGAFEPGPLPSQRRERAGGEVQLHLPRLTMRAEVMGARDGLLRRLGAYGLAAFRVAPPVQLVARVDQWDPDRARESGVTDALERQLTVGGNYLIENGGLRLAANLVHSSFPNVAAPESSNMLMLLMQATW